jgi:hypothetical protein
VRECRLDLSVSMECGSSRKTGGIRPHVVWFGEMPLDLEEVYQALHGCGTFISIGTSGNVYPAAGFVAEARAGGAHTIELNLEPSEGRSLFHEAVHGRATEIVLLPLPDVIHATIAARDEAATTGRLPAESPGQLRGSNRGLPDSLPRTRAPATAFEEPRISSQTRIGSVPSMAIQTCPAGPLVGTVTRAGKESAREDAL